MVCNWLVDIDVDVGLRGKRQLGMRHGLVIFFFLSSSLSKGDAREVALVEKGEGGFVVTKEFKKVRVVIVDDIPPLLLKRFKGKED
ncbi:LOW QUALITY PROTEIN: hypothetical protein V2J09_021865 [Rumex salicifolius]